MRLDWCSLARTMESLFKRSDVKFVQRTGSDLSHHNTSRINNSLIEETEELRCLRFSSESSDSMLTRGDESSASLHRTLGGRNIRGLLPECMRCSLPSRSCPLQFVPFTALRLISLLGPLRDKIQRVQGDLVFESR